jgi:BMFP domain-containing protein YqiC
MNGFVSKLLSNKLVEARNELDTKIKNLIEQKLNQIKLRITEELFGEGNVLKMGRTKLIKVRVRKGKVQRRKKFSAVKGYTIRGGKLTRMMPAERRHRKVAARRSKFKRRAKLKTSLRKRKISLRKRTALGL